MPKVPQISLAVVCKSKRQTVKQVNDSSESSDYDEVRVVDGNDRRNSKVPKKLNQFPKRLYALITVGKQGINFQLDSGATCNVISLSKLEQCFGKVQLNTTSRVLKMYNKAIVQPVGKCVL